MLIKRMNRSLITKGLRLTKSDGFGILIRCMNRSLITKGLRLKMTSRV